MSKEREDRIAKRQALIDMGIHPYANRRNKKQNISEITDIYRDNQESLRNIDDIIAQPKNYISTAGRLTLYRTHGKLSFGKIMDESGEIQVMRHRDNCNIYDNTDQKKEKIFKVNEEKFEHNIDDANKWRECVRFIIVDDQGKVGLMYSGQWLNHTLPGGGVDDGEKPEEALVREALEETGCEVQDMKYIYTGYEYMNMRISHQKVYMYICKIKGTKGLADLDEDEKEGKCECRWYTPQEAKQYLLECINNDNGKFDIIKPRLINDLHLLDIYLESIDKDRIGYNSNYDICDINGNISTPKSEYNAYKILEKYIDVGDIIGIEGDLFTTHKGEMTIFVSKYQLLSKALRPLGDKRNGIGEDNAETSYRQRYLDMIHNRDTLDRMKLRSKFMKTIRDFYHSQGFIEIETPVLGNSASGAAAAPFVTHHRDFGIDMYLRISPETSLKKATVGMLEKIFEVAKDFRNEGSDPSHHQEFTMIEHYTAYRNYEDNMHFTEEMFDYIFSHIPELSRDIQVADKNGNIKNVSFATPRARVDYIDQIYRDSGIDVSIYEAQDAEKLRKLIKDKGFNREGLENQTTATMIDYLYKKVTRPQIIGPAFVYNYPKTMQPLARTSDTNPKIVEQFQLLVNGREILKAYSELVDPIIQQANFDEQADAVAQGDDEATKGDDDFVLAMEYGMPCQSGRGMGVDRIFAMLTEQPNIRDVILFPMIKPINKNNNKINEDIEEDPTDTTDISTDNYTNMQNNLNISDNIQDSLSPKLYNMNISASAESLVSKYASDTLGHLQQVAHTMKYFASQLGQDEDYRYTVGLLHDIDRDHIHKDASQHLGDDFAKIIDQLDIDHQIKDQLKHDIRTHYPDGTGLHPDTLVQKYLISIDELSGLMYAYARMRGGDFSSMETKGVLKKIKDKGFAAGVDREHVRNCEKYLNITLEDFVSQMISAFQSFVK